MKFKKFFCGALSIALTITVVHELKAENVVHFENKDNPIAALMNYANTCGFTVNHVYVGQQHSAAILSDGSLYMWGENFYGQLGDGTGKEEGKNIPVKIMDNVASVSLNDGFYTAAITFDGSLYMWGANTYGELGDGTNEDRNVPVKVMDNVSSVSLKGSHVAAITTDGSLYMWGSNIAGELGNGKGSEDENNKIPIKIMDRVASVSLNDLYSAAITTDGSLYMWGSNYSCQLGDGTNENKNVPVKIMDNVASVSLSDTYSAAITIDESLYMWGNNSFGQLGDGTNENKKAPVKIMDNVSSVSLGGVYTAAITSNRSLYMWGCTSNYQGLPSISPVIGDGSNEGTCVPVKIMDNVASVYLSKQQSPFSAAITIDGSLYMWGNNSDSGRLGVGTNEDINVPVKIMDNVATVSLNYFDYSAAITTDGSLYMWGDNYSGQLGDGTNESKNTPVKIMDNISSVSFGYHCTIAITLDGSLYMWGQNLYFYGRYSQFGNGSIEDSYVPVKIVIPDILTFSDDKNNTGVIVVISATAIPEGTVLNVEKKTLTEYPNALAYEISLTFNGEPVSPSKAVTIKIPVPAEMKSDEVKVYYCDNDRKFIDTNAIISGDYIVFDVDCFSEYIVTTEQLIPDTIAGDVNNDQSVNDRDSISLDRYLGDWDIDILLTAADLNGDGKVNDQDSIILARTLAGWYE